MIELLDIDRHWIVFLAIIVAIVGVARLTRVIVHDDFPPAVWWRIKWATWTKDGPWSKLFLCWWCLSFWVALVCIGWFLLGDVHPIFAWSWWIFWGGLAVSYLATMLIVRDEPRE
jgi:undecaprenyl pyrophosphate phosphatase UppP